MKWITFETAAEIAGVTVGDLCSELSKSGCVDSIEKSITSVVTPPNYPYVRVCILSSPFFASEKISARELVTLRSRSDGAVHASHVDSDDLERWLADRSARSLAVCSLCRGSRVVLNLLSGLNDPCPKCC